MQPTADLRKVLEAFFLQDDIRLPMHRLESGLPAGAGLWVIGGAPRNALIEAIHGRSPLTEDIDVFIAGIDPAADLLGLEVPGARRRTELGGIRWFPEGSRFSFDIGVLSEFMVIKRFRLPSTPRSLLAAIDFDVNAVMWDWQRREVMAAGCLDAVSRRIMDFNTTLVFDHVLLAYRILLTRHKTGFAVSAAVFDYLKRTLDLERLERLKAMLVSKQGKAAAGEIMKECDLICGCSAYPELRLGMPG